MPAAMSKPYVSVKEAADYLGVSPKTIYNLIYRQELPCVRVGRAVRISAGDIGRYVDARTTDLGNDDGNETSRPAGLDGRTRCNGKRVNLDGFDLLRK